MSSHRTSTRFHLPLLFTAFYFNGQTFRVVNFQVHRPSTAFPRPCLRRLHMNSRVNKLRVKRTHKRDGQIWMCQYLWMGTGCLNHNFQNARMSLACIPAESLYIMPTYTRTAPAITCSHAHTHTHLHRDQKRNREDTLYVYKHSNYSIVAPIIIN